jgi:hypothetical protein
MEAMVHTKLLGLPTDNHLNLKNNEDQMAPRLSGTCYAVRSMFHISNINPFKPVYFTYFHSTTNDGIFGGYFLK